MSDDKAHHIWAVLGNVSEGLEFDSKTLLELPLTYDGKVIGRVTSVNTDERGHLFVAALDTPMLLTDNRSSNEQEEEGSTEGSRAEGAD